MPSSKPAPFSFVNMDELRDQLQFIVDDLYSKIDFALGLDGKGVMAPLEYGGLGRDLSAVSAILGIAGGTSIDVVALTDAGLLTDVTTLNASALAHGFLAKLSDNAAEFMNGKGLWAVPSPLWQYDDSLADDQTHELPTLTKAKFATLMLGDDEARSFVTIKSDGTINFLINDYSAIVANADTDGFFCIGTGVANPIILRNRTGAPVDVVFTMW